MATIHVDIVSAEGEIFSGEASMVFAPAVMGDIGIAPRHAPLLTTLKPGEVRVQTPDGEEQFFYVSGGAHRDPAAPRDRAGRHGAARPATSTRLRRCRRSSAPKKRCAIAVDKIELAEAQAELARAVAQIKAIEKLRKLKQ